MHWEWCEAVDISWVLCLSVHDADCTLLDCAFSLPYMLEQSSLSWGRESALPVCGGHWWACFLFGEELGVPGIGVDLYHFLWTVHGQWGCQMWATIFFCCDPQKSSSVGNAWTSPWAAPEPVSEPRLQTALTVESGPWCFHPLLLFICFRLEWLILTSLFLHFSSLWDVEGLLKCKRFAFWEC